jgi:diaminopimelate decarboxylase
LNNTNYFKNIIQKYNTPTYIYFQEKIEDNFLHLKNRINFNNLNIHFAVMANNNIKLLKILKNIGCGVFVTTLEELYLVKVAGFTNKDVIFQGNCLKTEEIKNISGKGINIICDSIEQVLNFKKIGGIKKIGIRIKYDKNFYNSIYENPIQRQGIEIERISVALELAKKNDIKISGFHSYIGTNVQNHTPFIKSLRLLIKEAKKNQNLEYIDLSGGFGISYPKNESFLNFNKLGSIINKEMNKLNTFFNKEIELKIEPGRILIGDSAYLLTRVTEIKRDRNKVFIGTDTNLSNFSRPYIYKEYHKIINLSQRNTRNLEKNVYICGNSAKSDDYFAQDISFPKTREGDILAITSVGAYGFSMSSNFCGRLKPIEILIKRNGNIEIIRKREIYKDLLLNQQ